MSRLCVKRWREVNSHISEKMAERAGALAVPIAPSDTARRFGPDLLTSRDRLDSSLIMPIRFDARMLYEALDSQRRERGMSWQQVGDEIGVSPSTLTRTKLGGRMEANGMLAMARWLGRTAESFTRHFPF